MLEGYIQYFTFVNNTLHIGDEKAFSIIFCFELIHGSIPVLTWRDAFFPFECADKAVDTRISHRFGYLANRPDTGCQEFFGMVQSDFIKKFPEAYPKLLFDETA